MSEPLVDSAINPPSYDITRINPTLYSPHIKLNDENPSTSGYIEQIELFIPTSYYKATYKSIVHFRKSDLPVITNNYIQLLELFGYLACSVFEHEDDYENGGTKKNRRIHLELVRENDVMYDEILGNILNNHRASRSLNDEELDMSNMDSFDFLKCINKLLTNFEEGGDVLNEIKDVIYQDDFIKRRKKLNVVGLRLRISLLSNKFSFAGMINTTIRDNEYFGSLDVRKKDNSSKKRKKNERPPLLHTTMTFADYARLCCFYTADSSIDTNNSHCHKNIWEQDNPLNPLNVFSVQRSMALARKAGADPIACNLQFYSLKDYSPPKMIETPKYPFKSSAKTKAKKDKPPEEAGAEALDEFGMSQGPVEDQKDDQAKIVFYLEKTISRYMFYYDVVELECKVINPNDLASYILPHKSLLSTTNEKDMIAYIQQHTGDYNSTPEEDKQRIIEAYQKTITCSLNDFKALDFDQLKHNTELIKLELKRISKGDLSTYGMLWKEARAVLFEQFMHIFSPDGNCGNAIKAIAKWGENYIQRNKHMCLPMPKITSNLTFFEDLLIVRATQQEVHEQTSASHIEGESQMVKMLHVYFGYALNPNILHVGAGDTGKSRMVDRVLKEFIEDSYEKISFTSAQALIIDGNSMDMMMMVLDDAPAIMLGASNEDKSDPEANKRGAFLKAMLTDGKLTQLTKRVDENGSHLQDKRTAILRMQLTVLMNELKKKERIDEAATTRFMKSDSEVPKRSDGLTTVNKNQIVTTHEMSIASMKKYERMKRTQYLIAMVGLLVHCGLMELDLSGARILNDHILAKAKERNLPGTEKPRNYHFIECIQRVLTAWKAIHTCFDAYDSEFLDYDPSNDTLKFTDWKPEHIFAVEKYLVCTKELVSISMGYAEKQFETPASQRIKQRLFIECGLSHRKQVQLPYNVSSSSNSEYHDDPRRQFSHESQRSRSSTNFFISRDMKMGIDRPATVVNSGTTTTNTTTSSSNSFTSPSNPIFFSNNTTPAVNMNNPEEVEKLLPIEDREEAGYQRLWFLPDSSIYQPWQRQNHATKYLQEIITPTMSINAIDQAIKSIKETMVPLNITDENSEKIPALKFGINCWKVAVSTLLIPYSKVLHSCVADTLNYKGSQNQDMLYGKANESALHIYEIVQVRSTDNCQPLVHKEHSFVDEEMMNIANVGLNSVKLSINKSGSDLINSIVHSNELYDEDPPLEPYEREEEIDYSTGRSKVAYQVINTDIDLIAISNHAVRCVLHPLELSGTGPDVHPFEHGQFLWKYMTRHDAVKLEYPMSLKLFNDKNYINDLHSKKCLSNDILLQQQQIIRSFYQNRKYKTALEQVMKRYNVNREKQNNKIRYFEEINKTVTSNVFIKSSSAPPSFGPSQITGSFVSQFSINSSLVSRARAKSNTLNFLIKDSQSNKKQKTNSDSSNTENINPNWDENFEYADDYLDAPTCSTTSSSSSSSSCSSRPGDGSVSSLPLSDIHIAKTATSSRASSTASSPHIAPIQNMSDVNQVDEEEYNLRLDQLSDSQSVAESHADDDENDRKSDDSPLATSSSQSGGSPKPTKEFNSTPSLVISRVEAEKHELERKRQQQIFHNPNVVPLSSIFDEEDTLMRN